MTTGAVGACGAAVRGATGSLAFAGSGVGLAGSGGWGAAFATVGTGAEGLAAGTVAVWAADVIFAAGGVTSLAAGAAGLAGASGLVASLAATGAFGGISEPGVATAGGTCLPAGDLPATCLAGATGAVCLPTAPEVSVAMLGRFTAAF